MINVPAAQQLRFAKKTPIKQPIKVITPKLLKDHNTRLQTPWTPSFSTAFRLIIIVRFFAGMYTAISDCDEGNPWQFCRSSSPSKLNLIFISAVFNYWDPLHYLLRGTGFQTWEYSPDFAIRSYFYLILHSIPNLISSQVLPHDKVFPFPHLPLRRYSN